jgi:hypothetical protein
MKKAFSMLMLVVVLYRPSTAVSDEYKPRLEFCGIKWRSHLEEARKAMLARPDVTEETGHFAPEHIVFTGGTFAGKPVRRYILYFLDDQFCYGTVELEINQNRPIEDYREIRALFSEKYGKPPNDFELFSYPYKENDGDNTQAIRTEKARFTALWAASTHNST